MSRLIAAAASLALLCACQIVSRAPESIRPLAPPISFDQNRRLEFDVTLERAGRSLRMRCVLELNGSGLAFAAFTPLGQPIFALSYGTPGVEVHSGSGLPRDFSPERIVADLQLVYWPLATLEASFSAAGWTLEEAPSRRILRHRGRVATDLVDMGDGKHRIRNWAEEYVMTMTRLDVAAK